MSQSINYFFSAANLKCITFEISQYTDISTLLYSQAISLSASSPNSTTYFTTIASLPKRLTEITFVHPSTMLPATTVGMKRVFMIIDLSDQAIIATHSFILTAPYTLTSSIFKLEL